MKPPHGDPWHVCDAVRLALEIEGMSQAELASRAGLTTKHISQLMTGKVPLSVDVALRIEKALPVLAAEDLMVAQSRQQVRDAKAKRRGANQ